RESPRNTAQGRPVWLIVGKRPAKFAARTAGAAGSASLRIRGRENSSFISKAYPAERLARLSLKECWSAHQGEQLMTRIWTLAVAALAAATIYVGAAAPAAATSRIKDLANIEGVRQNQLIGYGLVVGLNGTGDTLNNIPFTKQSLQAMLERLGVNIRGAT